RALGVWPIPAFLGRATKTSERFVRIKGSSDGTDSPLFFRIYLNSDLEKQLPPPQAAEERDLWVPSTSLEGRRRTRAGCFALAQNPTSAKLDFHVSRPTFAG